MTYPLGVETPTFDAGSFRDPAGRVFQHGGEIFRALSSSMRQDWQAVRQAEFFRRRMRDGSLVQTREVAADHPVREHARGWPDVLWHEVVPCISYPYEWSFGMLRAAALLQLQLLREALSEGLCLKDASPFNVQFRGTQPVFIDVGSFTRYVEGEPWAAYRQFCTLFLYPLLLQAYRGIDFQAWLRGSLQGISPRECRNLFSWRDILRPGLLTHVFLHAAMDRHVRIEDAGLSSRLRQQGFDKSLILKNLRGLTRLIEGLSWRVTHSRWLAYDSPEESASPLVRSKEEFVSQALAGRHWPVVWDLGCNAGRYSRLAAEHADLVVALDSDHATVERLYQSLHGGSDQRILPLRMNLADLSPGLGWRGRERARLEQRSRPDLVLCLAILHHLVLAENLPLPEIVDWLADLGGALVIEFVAPDDPRARALLAQRSDGGHEYHQELFETVLQTRYRITRRQQLTGSARTLYFAERIGA